MSTSLSFDCQRNYEPAATDPIEGKTWASLRVLVEGRCATQFWDRRANWEAEAIYIPTFPLARWLVGNWWSLFFEPCRQETPPPETNHWSRDQRHWIHRHCLRSAETGLFLPYLHIYSNGPGISVNWFADEPNVAPSMPGYFLYGGLGQLKTRDAIDGVSEFISKVLGWCNGIADSRVVQLRADWSAITNADKDEQAFCRAAGRMGQDPYAINQWRDGLSELLSTGLGLRADDPIVDDLLESAQPDFVSELWGWVSQAEASFDLQAGPIPQVVPGASFRKAKDLGYFMARHVRREANITLDSPIDDIGSLAEALGRKPLSFQEHNHLPNRAVLATVGWRNGTQPMIVGPRPTHPNSQRFLEARGLYQALTGCQQGARLVTPAYTWDQQAARAFAAELLAPQDALAGRTHPDMESEERSELERELANRYVVSTEVIRLQLQNQGVWRDAEP